MLPLRKHNLVAPSLPPRTTAAGTRPATLHAAPHPPIHLCVVVLLALQAAIPCSNLSLELVDLVVDHSQPPPQLANLVLQRGQAGK